MNSQLINAQDADNISQSINSGNTSICIGINQGLSYSEILDCINQNLKYSEYKIRKDLENNLELVKKEFARRIENLNQEFIKYKNTSLTVNLNDIGILRTANVIQNIYTDYPDSDLLNRLCDMLAYSAITPHSKITMLRIALLEAINTAKLITEEHLRLLSFIFLIRNCKFKSIVCIESFQFFLKEILWEFKPENLSNLTLPKHLEFSKCTTFVNREATIEKMLINTYLPALENCKTIELFNLTREYFFLSVAECLNLNAIPETSRLSNQFANNFNLRRQVEESDEKKYSKRDYCTSRKGNESEKYGKLTIKLLKELKDGERIQIEWVESPIKNHVLTPVGMVLAISYIRQKFKLNIPYDKWIY